MSDETTLADLLQLNLHRFEDEVRNIVDKAVKESGMEKVGFFFFFSKMCCVRDGAEATYQPSTYKHLVSHGVWRSLNTKTKFGGLSLNRRVTEIL